MVYQVPLTYTVLRKFTANGVEYNKDDVLTAAQAKGMRLGLLVSSKRLRPDIDPYARRAYDKIGNQPTTIVGKAYPKTATGTITAVVVGASDPGAVRFDASWPGRTVWDYGDGFPLDSQEDSHTLHRYSANGTYDVTAEGDHETAATSVTVSTVLVPPTGVTAGSPGSFQPANAIVPATLAALKADPVVGDAGTAKPSAPWTTGQYVVLGDATEAHFTTVWVSGRVALVVDDQTGDQDDDCEPDAAPVAQKPAKRSRKRPAATDTVDPVQEGPAE